MKFKMKLSKWLKDKSLAEGVKDSILGLVENPDDVFVERRFFAPAIEPKGESLKEGERAIIQYVSTRDLDRDNEILMPGGCDLSEFKKAPQVLWGHNYSMPPIGKDIWIKKDELGIKAKTEYADTERGEEVWTLRKGGFLNTSSVGFIPLETTTPEKDDWEETCDELKETWPGFSRIKKNVRRIIKKWLLLEHSDVSVPANINALTVAVAKGEVELSDEIRAELKVPKDEYLKAILNIAVKAKENIEAINKPPELSEEERKEIERVAKQDAINKEKQEALEEEYENAELFNDQKPLPNDHACRVVSPGKFKEGSFRTMSRESDGKKYSVIMGRLKGETTLTTQSYRYPKKTWPVATARKHCKGHDGILFEPARESRSAVRYIIRPLPKQETPENRKAEIEQSVRDEFNKIRGKV
jgi:phage head maturation protease